MSIDVVEDLTPRVQYVAGVGQTVFAYPFPVFQESDLVVDVDGALKTLTTHYTVTGETDDLGGDVTFLTPMTGGEIVTIYRDTTIERLTDLQQNGPMASSTLNDELDRLTVIAQEVRAALNRTMRLSQVDVSVDGDLTLPLKAARAGKYAAFDAAGLPIASSGTGNDTALRTDIASTTSGSDGARLVGYRRTEAGSVGRSVFAALFRSVYLDDFVTNSTPGTTDVLIGFTRGLAALVALGGGALILPAQRLKVSGPIARPLGVSIQGARRDLTIIEAAHNGHVIVRDSGTVPPSVDNDNYAFVDGITITNSGGFTPTAGLYYRSVAFTRASNITYTSGLLVGEDFDYVIQSDFSFTNNEAATGSKLASSSTADGQSIVTYKHYAWSANATLGISINGHGGYQIDFDTCDWFSMPTLAIDHVYSALTTFKNCQWEGNVVNAVKLRGGDSIIFDRCIQTDPVNLIDAASFGARNVIIKNPIFWIQSVQPPVPVNDEITVRDPSYTVDEAAGLGNTDEAHYFTEGHSTHGRQFANHPSYASSSAFYADSHITPLGGDIPSGAYNRIGSFNFTDGAQWTSVGTSGATDPNGGTTAYNLNNIASTGNGGNLLGAAATGRTFTFQVWAKFVGRVRLGIGTTNLGVVKRANFYSTTATWRLLSVTYTSGTDAGTTPLCNILTAQNTVMWRPCHFESFGPLPALVANRNLASIVGPIRVQDTRITVFGSATPAAGAFAVGDTTEQTVPVVGNPKRWRCTVAGSPGTWVSEGNL